MLSPRFFAAKRTSIALLELHLTKLVLLSQSQKIFWPLSTHVVLYWGLYDPWDSYKLVVHLQNIKKLFYIQFLNNIL